MTTGTSDVSSALVSLVNKARVSTVLHADPDFFVGPVGGRYVTLKNVIDLASQIGHPCGLNEIFFLLVVEEEGLYHIVGGSHRFQVICGMFPARSLAYKRIRTEDLFQMTGFHFSLAKYDSYVIAAVLASESRSVEYSPLEDCIQFIDIIRKSGKFNVEQAEIIKERGLSVGITTSAGSHLKFYESRFHGMCHMLDIEPNRTKKTKIIRGIAKLEELDDKTFETIVHFIMSRGIVFTTAQLMTISNWKTSDVNLVVDQVVRHMDNSEAEKLHGQKLFVRKVLDRAKRRESGQVHPVSPPPHVQQANYEIGDTVGNSSSLEVSKGATPIIGAQTPPPPDMDTGHVESSVKQDTSQKEVPGKPDLNSVDLGAASGTDEMKHGRGGDDRTDSDSLSYDESRCTGENKGAAETKSVLMKVDRSLYEKTRGERHGQIQTVQPHSPGVLVIKLPKTVLGPNKARTGSPNGESKIVTDRTVGEPGEQAVNPVSKESLAAEGMVEYMEIEDRPLLEMEAHTLSVYNEEQDNVSSEALQLVNAKDQEMDLKGAVPGHGTQSEEEPEQEGGDWDTLCVGMDVDSETGEQPGGQSATATLGSCSQVQPKASKEIVSRDKRRPEIQKKHQSKKHSRKRRSGKGKMGKGKARAERLSAAGRGEDVHLGGTVVLHSSRRVTEAAVNSMVGGLVHLEMQNEAKGIDRKNRDMQYSKGRSMVPAEGPEGKAGMEGLLIDHGLGFDTVGIPKRFLPYWKIMETRSETFQYVNSAIRSGVQAVKWKGNVEGYTDQLIELSKTYKSINMVREIIEGEEGTGAIFKIGYMWQQQYDRMGKRLIDKRSIVLTDLKVDGYLDLKQQKIEWFECYGGTMIDSECIDLMTQYLFKHFLQSKNNTYVLPTIAINEFFTGIERYKEQLKFQLYVKNRADECETLHVAVNEENHWFLVTITNFKTARLDASGKEKVGIYIMDSIPRTHNDYDSVTSRIPELLRVINGGAKERTWFTEINVVEVPTQDGGTIHGPDLSCGFRTVWHMILFHLTGTRKKSDENADLYLRLKYWRKAYDYDLFVKCLKRKFGILKGLCAKGLFFFDSNVLGERSDDDPNGQWLQKNKTMVETWDDIVTCNEIFDICDTLVDLFYKKGKGVNVGSQPCISQKDLYQALLESKEDIAKLMLEGRHITQAILQVVDCIVQSMVVQSMGN